MISQCRSPYAIGGCTLGRGAVWYAPEMDATKINPTHSGTDQSRRGCDSNPMRLIMTTDHEWLELLACHLTNRDKDLVRSPLPPEIAKLLSQLIADKGSDPDPIISAQDVH